MSSAVKEAVTVVVPLLRPFTSPFDPVRDATLVSPTDQVIVEPLYLSGLIVAVNVIVFSTLTEAEFGSMLIEGVVETVTVQEAVTSPYWALIVAVPSFLPVTTPPGATSATSEFSVDQMRSLALIQLGVISAEISAFSPVATAVSASLI